MATHEVFFPIQVHGRCVCFIVFSWYLTGYSDLDCFINLLCNQQRYSAVFPHTRWPLEKYPSEHKFHWLGTTVLAAWIWLHRIVWSWNVKAQAKKKQIEGSGPRLRWASDKVWCLDQCSANQLKEKSSDPVLQQLIRRPAVKWLDESGASTVYSLS